MKKFWNQRVFSPYYEGEGGVEGGEGSGEGKGGEGGEPKTFTQDQVNTIIAERLKKTKIEQDKLVKQLEELRKNKNLSDEERSNLTKRIDDLQSSMMTKEEIAAKEKKDLESKYAKDLDTKTKEAQTWQERYTRSTIQRALLDAASEHKAVRGQQIVDLLENRTRLVEEVDPEGQPTGNFVPQVKFDGRDKDGKPVTLDLPVKEALKQMKSMAEEYGNLFLSDATGGIGGHTTTPGSSKGVNFRDTASYIEARKKGLKLDQLKV